MRVSIKRRELVDGGENSLFAPDYPMKRYHEQIIYSNYCTFSVMTATDLYSTEVAALCRKYHAQTLNMFGSMARGEARPESDIDLLVRFSEPVTLLQLVALERELSAILGRKVDLVTEASISPYLRKQILKEQRSVYAAR